MCRCCAAGFGCIPVEGSGEGARLSLHPAFRLGRRTSLLSCIMYVGPDCIQGGTSNGKVLRSLVRVCPAREALIAVPTDTSM